MNQKLPKNIWLNGICDYIHEESEKAKSHCGRHHDDGTALGWSCVRAKNHDGLCHAHTGHGECFAQWGAVKGNQRNVRNIWKEETCAKIRQHSLEARLDGVEPQCNSTIVSDEDGKDFYCTNIKGHEGLCHAHSLTYGICRAQWDRKKDGKDKTRKSKSKGRIIKMEHPDDMFKMLFERITGHEVESKKGREVGKLSPEELASLELHNSKVKQLLQEKERIIEELQMSEIERRRWWRKVEKNHNAVGNSLTIEDGVLYEIDKEN